MTSSCGTLYHNPRCSKSREALALLQARGVAPDIVLYLESPPSIASLRELLRMLGSGPREILRTGEAEFDAMGLGDPGVDDATLLAAMHAHPRLIEDLCPGQPCSDRPPTGTGAGVAGLIDRQRWLQLQRRASTASFGKMPLMSYTTARFPARRRRPSTPMSR